MQTYETQEDNPTLERHAARKAAQTARPQNYGVMRLEVAGREPVEVLAGRAHLDRDGNRAGLLGLRGGGGVDAREGDGDDGNDHVADGHHCC